MLSCSFLNVKFRFFQFFQFFFNLAVEERLRHFEEIKFLTFKHQDLRRILLFFQRRRFRNLVFFNGKRERERERERERVFVGARRSF